jgi:choline-sulfatase
MFRSLVFAFAFASPAFAAEPPNVLFIAIDDLNDWVGCLKGHPQALTPNIDKLAARGTLFTNAHCQAPLCNPSRISVLTGLRPGSTGIYGLAPGLRTVDATKDRVTLPQTFTEAGYTTFTCGKIYHPGSVPPKARAAEFNEWGIAPGMGKPEKRFAQLPGTPHPLMDWGPFPAKAEDAADHKIAGATIDALAKAPKGKPFFIACGFALPHVPCFAPQEWFDKFPMDTLQMPPVQENDRDDTPRFSWYLHWNLPEPRLKTLVTANEWKPLVRAYLASIAFMDHQVGRVLEGLEKTGRAGNTIVVLWSDHGYHLGEKQITGKNTLWERSTRVPLVFAGPGVSQGAKCGRPVELLDIYPTLLELTGKPPRKDLEGLSLVPLLKDATSPRDRPAITTHNPGNNTVRSERWRYIRYADGSEELYDHSTDPNEWTNLAAKPEHAGVKKNLAKWIPTQDRPHAPGSAQRILTYDPQTKAVTWEGKPVKESDPIPEP